MDKTSLLKNILKVNVKITEEIKTPEKSFYASSKMFNSPDPKDVPLPDFDEENFFLQKIDD